MSNCRTTTNFARLLTKLRLFSSSTHSHRRPTVRSITPGQTGQSTSNKMLGTILFFSSIFLFFTLYTSKSLKIYCTFLKSSQLPEDFVHGPTDPYRSSAPGSRSRPKSLLYSLAPQYSEWINIYDADPSSKHFPDFWFTLQSKVSRKQFIEYRCKASVWVDKPFRKHELVRLVKR